MGAEWLVGQVLCMICVSRGRQAWQITALLQMKFAHLTDHTPAALVRSSVVKRLWPAVFQLSSPPAQPEAIDVDPAAQNAFVVAPRSVVGKVGDTPFVHQSVRKRSLT